MDVARSPRALWVTWESPDRALGGGNIRQAHLLEALASTIATDLLTVGPVADERVRAAVASVTELPSRRPREPTDPIGRRALELAITLGSPYPLTAYHARPSRQVLARALSARAQCYDLVCVEHEVLAPLLPKSRDGRWLLTFHHVLSGMIETDLERAPGRRQRWFRARDLDKALRLERRALRGFDRCLACSPEDAAALEAIAAGDLRDRVAVIPNGVDLGSFTHGPLPRDPIVLLPGTLDYPPNVEGALWFCAEIWPAVRAAVPDARFVLAGRAPVAEVRALERVPGVSVHADVPSMVPYFEGARAVVVPLRVGTGTRLKALEAMAAARPVIGTRVGLEGIGVVDGAQALVADEPEAFGRAVVEVLSHDHQAEALARAGRSHVERQFGWDRIGADFVKVVSEQLEQPPATVASR